MQTGRQANGNAVILLASDLSPLLEKGPEASLTHRLPIESHRLNYLVQDCPAMQCCHFFWRVVFFTPGT